MICMHSAKPLLHLVMSTLKCRFYFPTKWQQISKFWMSRAKVTHLYFYLVVVKTIIWGLQMIIWFHTVVFISLEEFQKGKLVRNVFYYYSFDTIFFCWQSYSFFQVIDLKLFGRKPDIVDSSPTWSVAVVFYFTELARGPFIFYTVAHSLLKCKGSQTN